MLLLVVVGGPLIGWAYEQYAVRRDARRFPPPGQFVQVEPVRRLHYVCSGSGSPLVLFEVSGFSNSMSFREARAGLSQRTRVCSYDRVGIGWSDKASSTIPVSMLAKDLGTLLDELSPREPAVLVASSIGGVTAEFFARQHPERVAGLVFLDAGNSQAFAAPQHGTTYRRWRPPGAASFAPQARSRWCDCGIPGTFAAIARNNPHAPPR